MNDQLVHEIHTETITNEYIHTRARTHRHRHNTEREVGSISSLWFKIQFWGIFSHLPTSPDIHTLILNSLPPFIMNQRVLTIRKFCFAPDMCIVSTCATFYLCLDTYLQYFRLYLLNICITYFLNSFGFKYNLCFIDVFCFFC